MKASERVRIGKRQLWTLFDTKKNYCFSAIFFACKMLLGSVGGVRQRGRPPKKWTDNITEWTELILCEAARLSQDQETCRKSIIGRKEKKKIVFGLNDG